MALDVDAVRALVPSSLGDEALQARIDAAYEALDDYLGIDTGEYDGATLVELLTPRSHRNDLLMLSRRAMTVLSVKEGTVTLAGNDYRLVPSGNMLERLGSGTNPALAWRRRTEVRYVTVLDGAERDRIAVALVNLDLNYSPGVVQETIGAWSEQQAQGDRTYARERATILASYGTGSHGAMI